MYTVAYIPARGGSKGIPMKNIVDLLGKPLIYWAIQAAENCEAIDTIYVGTDDYAISEIVRAGNFSKVQVIGRPPETCTDNASTESALINFCQFYRVDRVILMQATSPFVISKDLDRAVAMMDSGYDSVVSCTRKHIFLWKEYFDSGVPQNYSPASRPRRQDWEGELVENGAFYGSTRDDILEYGCRLNGKIGIVEMPEFRSIEIDSPEDLKIAKAIGGEFDDK